MCLHVCVCVSRCVCEVRARVLSRGRGGGAGRRGAGRGMATGAAHCSTDSSCILQKGASRQQHCCGPVRSYCCAEGKLLLLYNWAALPTLGLIRPRLDQIVPDGGDARGDGAGGGHARDHAEGHHVSAAQAGGSGLSRAKGVPRVPHSLHASHSQYARTAPVLATGFGPGRRLTSSAVRPCRAPVAAGFLNRLHSRTR